MMENFFNHKFNRHVFPWMFFLIIFGSPMSVLCMDRNTEEKIEILEPALIKSKGDNGVIIDGRRYEISESTIILDLLGKEILLCDLPIPCEALVEYRMITERDPVCVRIEVKRLLEDSKDSS